LSPTLARISLRYLVHHPWQTWLSLAGIALGVAVVVAVDLANQSAQRAFALSVERVAGRATHQIEGAGQGIPEEVYAELRLNGVRPAAPVLEGSVLIQGQGFTLLGLDPLASTSLSAEDLGIAGAQALTLLTEPGALLLSPGDARRLGLGVGDAVPLVAAGTTHPGHIAGLVEGPNPAALEGLVVADIATAQELLGRIGTIDRIQLVLTPEGAQDLSGRLRPGLRLGPTAQRTRALGDMTRAFRSNLTAMSLLAALVGGFIVYNTMTFAVLQRRPLLGILRTLGVTRAEVFRLVLAEALALALIGALLGLALGLAAGAGLVQLVTRTIDDLYFNLTVRAPSVSLWPLAKGVAVGTLISLVAALGPALEAARSQPRDVLRRHAVERAARRLLPWTLGLGGILLAAGLGLLRVPGGSLVLGFAALFLAVLGFSLWIPPLLGVIAAGLAPLLGRLAGVQGRLAARGITAALSRTGVAAAALTVAVSATVGVGIMIDSFRAGVVDWLGDTLRSDLYVSAVSGSFGRNGGTLPEDLAARIAALPEVAALSRGRSARVQAATGPVQLLALRTSAASQRGFRFRGKTMANLWQGFERGTLVLISEPYAYHHGVKVGDTLRLFTAQGWRGFRVGGVFFDYGSDSGMLVLAQRRYAELWADPGISTLGLILGPGVESAAVTQAVQAAAAQAGTPVLVRTSRTIRDQSLVVFDRTFLVTRVLRLLTLGVAFIGVLSALMALQLERAREHAILRATGMTSGQLVALVLIQTSIIGVAAGLLAIPLGIGMGALLIDVINVRSFGWTIPMSVNPSAALPALMLAWGAALLAGLYPALRAAGTDPATALREA
jgi:putative ABC transport system permease protein